MMVLCFMVQSFCIGLITGWTAGKIGRPSARLIRAIVFPPRSQFLGYGCGARLEI